MTTTHTHFYRVQFTLSATRSVELPGRPAALLYALLSNANSTSDIPPAYPADLMLDAPETNRTRVAKDQPYNFGGTLIAATHEQVQAVVTRLRDGLERLGSSGKSRTRGWGGNFQLASVTDLVRGQPWFDGTCQPISLEHVDAETMPLLEQEQLTVNFETPLRLERRSKSNGQGHRFFDEQFFDASYFLRRIMRRLASIGLQLREGFLTDEALAGQVVDRRLIWLDIAYGGRTGKTLGGAVGRVTLSGVTPLGKAALVWGQYARLGKNTSFGFGRYRIEEAGDDPFRCRRAVQLLDLAWQHPDADRLVERAGLEPGVLRGAIADIAADRYVPHPVQRIEISRGEKARMLQIPSRRDRILQRMVLDAIGPGIDQLFEASSHAWRRGLSRQHSAKAIGRAYQAGYRFAVHADFDRFFESIPHEILTTRLSAYLDDPAAQALILQWVKNGRCTEVGIPTGAPLSPLLGNAMLDRFDETIRDQGGRLVRYGDDFLILCKDNAQADRLSQEATAHARQLELTLNEAPVKLDLNEPFTFLGFRFEKQDLWRMSGQGKPRRIEELGWRDAESLRQPKLLRLSLAGETGKYAPTPGMTGIVGPGATHFEVSETEICCHYSENRPAAPIPLGELDTLVVLGRIGFNSAMVEQLCQRNISLLLADENGLVYATLTDDDISVPDLVRAQVEVSQNEARRLEIARTLMAAKLINYANLAAALPKPETDTTRFLLRSAERAGEASSIGSLLGIEGAAAAAWYKLFGKNVGRGYSFPGRVAPGADDPVNILLNIGHTLLYRLSSLLLRGVGFVPGIGLYHQPTQRFDALASDLQEPLRHLVDRAVIEATHVLRPGEFSRVERGPYQVRLAPTAAREFQALLWRVLSLETTCAGRTETLAYRVWMHRQARHLARHLTDPKIPFTCFRSA